MSKKIHFGWFSQYAEPVGFNHPNADPGAIWSQAESYQKMAQISEQGKFDIAIFADNLGISLAYDDSIETYVKHGLTVNHDSTVLAAMVAAKTDHLGVATTLSTSLTPPYQLARQLASFDHLSKGRVAWNIVTSYNKAAFANYGIEEVAEHDARYDQADEFMDLCYQLWGSWEPDAVIMDKEQGIFADPTKVKAINFNGKNYKSAGPLNMVPPLKGKPVTVQAGTSDRGMDFAARWSDAVIASKQTEKDMKSYYDTLKDKVVKFGRKPEELKVFFIIKPIFAETEDQAKKIAEQPVSDQDIERAVAALAARMNMDLSKLNLDEPVPIIKEGTISGGQTTISRHQTEGNRPTLREIARREVVGNNLNIIGSYEQVADRLIEIMNNVGGDGFVLRVNSHEHSYLQEFVDKVIPILQEKGAARKEYTQNCLHDNLFEF